MKMRRYPAMWTAEALVQHAQSGVRCKVHDEYVPARPWLWNERWTRFKCAWRVFTGRCDALLWPEDDCK